MTTGERIGLLAAEKGISLRKLSEKACIPYTTLYSIVRRNSDKISMKTLGKIADALDVSITEVFGDATTSMIFQSIELFEQLPTERPPDLTARMEQAFSALNDAGQEVACERVEELAEIPKYQRTQDEAATKPIDTPLNSKTPPEGE